MRTIRGKTKPVLITICLHQESLLSLYIFA